MRRTFVLLAAACAATVALVGPVPEPTASAGTTATSAPAASAQPARTPLPRPVIKRLARQARALAAADATHSAGWHFERLCRQWRRAHGHTLGRRAVKPLPRTVVKRLARQARQVHRKHPSRNAYQVFLRLAAEWRREHARPGPAAVVPAIRHVARKYGLNAAGMIRVAHCESTLYRKATNGQYLGLFQLGEFARNRYLQGHWTDAYANAEAAARYVRAAGGWSPWGCGWAY